MWNDDSLLLIDTPNALILNLNDAKPLPPVLKALCRLADRIGKPRILLCSYSPASVVNSFLDDNGVVSPAIGASLCRLCLSTMRPARASITICHSQAKRFFAVPIASGRTTIARLMTIFVVIGVHVLNYCRPLQPSISAISATPRCRAEAYQAANPSTLARRVTQRMTEEQTADLTTEEIALLERKLNVFRWLLWVLFPRGFTGFV